MGFRAVTDLSDYSTSELLQLIKSATDIISSRLVGEPSGSSVNRPVATAASSDSQVSEVSQLKNPLTCEFKCRHCDAQCYRVTSHVYHACAEHKHLR